MMKHTTLRVVPGLVAVVAALVVALPASAGGNGAQVTTFDPVAEHAQFVCTNATYTAVGGIVQQVMRDSFDATGGEHVTGTITPKGVTLTDAEGNLYRLVGALWFGGSFTATGHGVFTDTGHFNIIAADGTVVGRVSTTEHMGTNGSTFSFVFGNCTAPND